MAYSVLNIPHINKDLGYFNIFPNELFNFLTTKFDSKSFLNFRRSHPVIGCKFSQTFVLNQYFKKNNQEGRMILFEKLFKNPIPIIWAIKHLIILGYNDLIHIQKALKHFIVRDKITVVNWLLRSVPELNISFESNFLLRWAFRKNHIELVRYICSRPDLDISINNYNIIKMCARYFTWAKHVALDLIIPIRHEFLMIKIFKYACKYNNEYIIRVFSDEYFQFNLEEETATSSIIYESWECLESVFFYSHLETSPLEWFYIAIANESIVTFRCLLRHSPILSRFDQNQFLVRACMRGNLQFLKVMNEHGIPMIFDSTLDLIGVYALSIFYNWQVQFDFLMEHYPLPFSNYQTQWLLFFCVNINAIFFFKKLVQAGCKPIPIKPENMEMYSMDDAFSPFLSNDNERDSAGNLNIISQKKEINLVFENYYVFFCQKLFVPVLQEHISFVKRIISTNLSEKDENYFLQFRQDSQDENWEHFNMFLERDDEEWYQIVSPSPLFSKELTFNISYPNIEFNGKNPFQRFHVKKHDV